MVNIQVTRGSESWQFFAFVFAAVFGLAVTLFDDLAEARGIWVKVSGKAGLFIATFYLFMINNWVRNELVKFLNWLKVEHY